MTKSIRGKFVIRVSGRALGQRQSGYMRDVFQAVSTAERAKQFKTENDAFRYLLREMEVAIDCPGYTIERIK